MGELQKPSLQKKEAKFILIKIIIVFTQGINSYLFDFTVHNIGVSIMQK